MIVSCPECGARYKLPPQAIPPEGRAMRCASCKHRWFELGAEADRTPGTSPAVPGPATSAAPPQPVPEDSSGGDAGAGSWAGWRPAAPADDPPDEPQSAARSHGIAKTLFALLLSAALFAGAAAMWLPDLPPLDTARVPWLDALVHPPAPVRSPLTVAFGVDRQPLGDGRTVFALTGTLSNPTAAPQPVPSVEARLVDEGGAITYRWPVAVPAGVLPAHARLAFEASAIGDAAAGTRVVVALR